jgi:hypothetical protein
MIAAETFNRGPTLLEHSYMPELLHFAAAVSGVPLGVCNGDSPAQSTAPHRDIQPCSSQVHLQRQTNE